MTRRLKKLLLPHIETIILKTVLFIPDMSDYIPYLLGFNRPLIPVKMRDFLQKGPFPGGGGGLGSSR